jgi:hypothetical protein
MNFDFVSKIFCFFIINSAITILPLRQCFVVEHHSCSNIVLHILTKTDFRSYPDQKYCSENWETFRFFHERRACCRKSLACLIRPLRGGVDDVDKESSLAEEDKALLQKLLRQQEVSSKTEKKKEKR